jgi:hypothetical protein
MPYSAPNVFVAGTPMSGPDLSENNTALRTYLNVGIVAADIPSSSVTTTDIVRGEYVGVTPDHQFTTGDLYTQFIDLLRTNERYFTSHIKPYDLTGVSPYQIIPDSGKRIVLEKPSDVMFSVAFLGVGNGNYELAPQRLRNPGFVGHTEGDVLRTSDIDLCTAGHSFTEDELEPLGLPYVIDADGSGNATQDPSTFDTPGSIGLYGRRWYCQRLGFPNLPAGVHHFYIAMNPRCDKGHIKVLQSEIEVFHRRAAEATPV